MSALEEFVNKQVLVITTEGRVILGNLKGFDQTTNVVLTDSSERIFSEDEGVESIALGLYFIRGDSIATVGLVDPEKDASIQLAAIHAKPIPEIVH
ncbi:n-alpha-acetyltransferase 38, NatC auxiliary subunit-like protein [Dimargaris cristalligena]|uniref:LSM2-LSM8 complex subunit LSM8 n=1 Tax=Dimargaris cristalligena TaxID=215637 RepID=A0A4P9ZXV5_9FUNG|nr:n-alpha-acetyltransferase 38, NatC auxiliary subunit-like protein [Dimargaris cristalligena]|eukprot:RKP37580.1 n-alpha-acetyltransferase 38, NatC auxiliary subunit-like protein [Dimargaris cristalligena]